MTPNVIVSPAGRFPVDAATLIASNINKILGQKNELRMALSGGNTPRVVNKELVKHEIDWSRIYLYWGDERMVPHYNIDSNYRMNRDSLINSLAIPPKGIFPIPYNKSSAMSAELYEKTLYKSMDDVKLDIVLLGMGDDGHIASLFPHQEYNDEHIVVSSTALNHPVNRVSLSMQLIARSEVIFIMLNGIAKAEMIAKVLNKSIDVPAAELFNLRPDIIWLLDTTSAQCLTIPG